MKDLLLRNWHLKLISLGLAAALWAQVARTPTSEIGVAVSVEYQNFPEKTEVFGDTSERVEVRLRGPSSLLRTLTSEDVSLTIDVKGMPMGEEKVLPLTPELVNAPFGVDVVRVIPARVRLTVEPTAVRQVRIAPNLTGSPAPGFELARVSTTPETVQIEGPSSHVLSMEPIETAPVDVRGRKATFSEAVELDIQDPLVRVPRPSAITVEVRIRPQSK